MDLVVKIVELVVSLISLTKGVISVLPKARGLREKDDRED